MTQELYQTLTGLTVNYSDADWEAIVAIAEMRLASFLCLEEFPELTDDNQDLAMLLANFIAATLKYQGNYDAVEEKRIRNFTIRFNANATNAFGQIYAQYRDIIERYSQCDLDIHVEGNRRECCRRGYINF